MPISLLRIENFRNLTNVELVADPVGLNVIHGENGSGKTSILEAIYYLGHGRSFRTSQSIKLIQHNKDRFAIFSQLLNEIGSSIPIGTERYQDGSSLYRLNEKNINNISNIAHFMPIRVVNSQSHELMEAGPSGRRSYLDWGLFYQQEGFLHCWRHYERALKQRNKLLKEKSNKNQIDAWSVELVKHGILLDEFRKNYIKALLPEFSALTYSLLGIEEVDIVYSQGWDSQESFEIDLARSYPEECRYGTTQLGPHRADFEIMLEGISAKHYLSRGQQKLLICAMILAQGRVLAKMANKTLTYLVDDLPAELDLESRSKLIASLISQQTQVFITAIEGNMISTSVRNQSDMPVNLFHVEHGQVKQAIPAV